MELLSAILTGVVLLTWLGPLVEACLFGRDQLPLDRQTFPEPAGGWPRVSIVVPACNESATIVPAMRSLLAIDYPDFEIIAVDDRSTDATGALLDELAAGDGRLRVLHIGALPAGWLGKNHALHRGAEQATGEYILFTDADVVMRPDVLRRAVACMVARNQAHLTLGSRIVTHGWLETSMIAFFMLLFLIRFRPWMVPRRWSRAHAGVGAFNMVRTAEYRAAGGHVPLAMEVIDDVKLGKLMKRATGRSACLAAGDLVRVRWVEGVGGMVHGLEKNAFAGFGFQPLGVIAGMAFVLLLAWWPWVALVAGGGWGVRAAAALAVAGSMLSTAVFGMGQSIRWHHALGYGIAAPVMGWIFLRSMVMTYRRGGVVWRGTLYRLDDLRKGRY